MPFKTTLFTLLASSLSSDLADSSPENCIDLCLLILLIACYQIEPSSRPTFRSLGVCASTERFEFCFAVNDTTHSQRPPHYDTFTTLNSVPISSHHRRNARCHRPRCRCKRTSHNLPSERHRKKEYHGYTLEDCLSEMRMLALASPSSNIRVTWC
jgi:hypothetical protein